MLTTALMLAVTLNSETTRAGITALIHAGPNPIRRLATLLCGIFAMGFTVGFLILFVFQRAFIGREDFEAGKLQIGIGMAALVLAAIVATDPILSTRRRQKRASERALVDDGAVEFAQVGFFSKLITRSAKLTQESPSWVLFVLGSACSLPSVDYVAMLLLIAASEAPRHHPDPRLSLFLTVGNSVSAIPLISYRIASTLTLRKVEAFQSWIHSRGRRHIAAHGGGSRPSPHCRGSNESQLTLNGGVSRNRPHCRIP